ncbi:MAG TPA: hypothetical protein VIE66_14245 [Methylocella sp.]
MSINPASDIVLDVAKAADPIKFRVATEKLWEGNSTFRIPMNGFDQTLARVNAMQEVSRNSYAADGRGRFEILQHGGSQMKAYKGLEQLILKNLVETMLPKDSGVLYGNGTAGDIWRSFLADQLANQVGKSIDLGVVPKSMPSSDSATGQPVLRKSVQILTADGVPHSESM